MPQYTDQQVIEAFWEKVDQSGDCWLWTACRNWVGYGLFRFGTPRRMGHAHRFSWELANGPIPAGLHVLHRCDVPACVNPEHLFVGTVAENMADMRSKGRGARGEKSNTAKLKEAQAREIWTLKGKDRAVELAQRFEVSTAAIYAIWRGDAWAHIHQSN